MSEFARENKQTGLHPWHSTVGLVAAIAAFVGASCCVLPLVLASVGLAGAWIASLEVFVIYRRPVTAIALIVIAIGWGSAFRRRSSWSTVVVLGCASVLVLGALVLMNYEGPITRYVLSIRRD
jgi:mercuric ion transport protein